MTWSQLMAWRKEMIRSLTARHADGGPTDPDSWAGADRDPWWEEQRRKRQEARRV